MSAASPVPAAATRIPAEPLRRRFRAMGTDVEILLDAPDTFGTWNALETAEREIRRLESILSRFDPASELSCLNHLGALAAGPDLARVTRAAIAARDRTGGRFDPTVHGAVCAAGYDRSFEQLPADGVVAAGPAPRCGGRVEVDRSGRITLGDGVALDLGGIAKGDAADRVAAMLAEHGPCLVNAGGDLAATPRRGDAPWPVELQTPTGSLTIGIDCGGVATSGTDRRRWHRRGREYHHIIDPARGRPATGDLLRVTVVADSAVRAETWATALFVEGAAAAREEADARGIPCALVTTDGRVVLAGGLR